MMGLNQPWEHLVPPAVARLVRDLGLEERLRLQTNWEAFSNRFCYV